MISLSNLSPFPGSTKPKKRVGRGIGSGHGKTSCKGHKGARARSGHSLKPGFEGGQMPLQRRLPKGGFSNLFRTIYSIVNIDDLNIFEDGTIVTKDLLLGMKLVKKSNLPVKILGDGDLSKKLTIKVDKLSRSAVEKIKAAGGCIEE